MPVRALLATDDLRCLCCCSNPELKEQISKLKDTAGSLRQQ